LLLLGKQFTKLRRSDVCVIAVLGLDVELLELVETGEHTGTGNTTEDVGTGTLEEGHEAFSLHDLGSAVQRRRVHEGLVATRGHHHSTTDGVNWVRQDARDDGDGVSDGEGDQERWVLAGERHDGVVETEVETSVDEDADERDGKTTVETLDTVRGEGLLVDVNETGVLTGAAGLRRLEVVSKTGTGVVERVHEEEAATSGKTAGSDVLDEGGGVAITLGLLEEVELLEHWLEGEVQSLGWKVSQAVGEVGLPEGHCTFVGHDPSAAVHDALEWLFEGASLEHLVLVLNDHLDTFNWGSDGLGGDRGSAGEPEGLVEFELNFLSGWHVDLSGRKKKTEQ